MSSQRNKALVALQSWYDALDRQRGHTMPPRGMIANALVLLERLNENYSLLLKDHLARGGAQIRGASGASLKKLLSRFGEKRPFLGEGGRTNRGVPGAMGDLLRRLEPLNLERTTAGERTETLLAMQEFLVDRVLEWHSRQRIKLDFDPSDSTWQIIQDLVQAAASEGKASAVAQYLVGAKLKLRFPLHSIGNDLASAADQPSDRPGDFVVGKTVFHVTISPQQGHFEKCERNIREGFRPYLIVPDEWLTAARKLAGRGTPRRITIASIEGFVSQNIEEQAEFTPEGLSGRLRELLNLYNQRVNDIESDKSLLIEIPKQLS